MATGICTVTSHNDNHSPGEGGTEGVDVDRIITVIDFRPVNVRSSTSAITTTLNEYSTLHIRSSITIELLGL